MRCRSSDSGVGGGVTGQPALPDEPGRFDVERTSVRVVLLDGEDRILLFHTVDPTMPELGHWWELPGGGMEPGESVAETAVRELAEETGFAVTLDAVSVPTWTRSATYLRRGRRTLQHEFVVLVRVAGSQPAPSAAGQTDEELEDYLGHRWWDPVELAGSAERFFPGALPRYLGSFLSGDVIDEPFESWN